MRTIPVLFTFVFVFFSIEHCFAQEWERMNFLFEHDVYFHEPTQKPLTEYINNPHNASILFEGNLTTYWIACETYHGDTNVLYFSTPQNFRTLNFLNNLVNGKRTSKEFNRPKRIKLTHFAAINPLDHISESTILFLIKQLPGEHIIALKDKATTQSVKNPFDLSTIDKYFDKYKQEYSMANHEPINTTKHIIRLEFVEVYSGETNELSLSQIFFNNSFLTDYRGIEQKEVKNVYVDELNESKILAEYSCGSKEIVLDEPDSVFQLIETSSDNKWATVIRMPALDTGGRMETEYLLINILLGKIINPQLEEVVGDYIYGPFFLEEREGKTFLLLSDNEIELK